MKKQLVNLSKILVSLSLFFTMASSNIGCMLWAGQDELPEKAKNLRRF